MLTIPELEFALLKHVAFSKTLASLKYCVLMIVAATAMLFLQSDRVQAGKPVFVGDAKATLVSMSEIDHSVWTELLTKYVDPEGRVAYEAWHKNRDDRAALEKYLNQLSTASTGRDEATNGTHRLAFWINAYNALTIHGILREFPTTSIRNHTPKLWGYHIWHDLKLYVGRKPYSLDEIEHQVLRKMGEPRIHFAIVCASIGCPRLLDEAYVPEKIDEQLTTNAKHFFSKRQNFRYDAAEKRFYLSEILNWFGEDFGSSQAKVLKRIAAWLPTDAAQTAARANSVSVSYLDYNWNLNTQ